MQKFLFLLLWIHPFLVKAQVEDSSQRKIDMKGAANFRDEGGYETTDGRQLKWGKVYRSAEINKLTDEDMALLQTKHINTVIDFRGTDESAKAPDRLLSYTDYTLLPAGSENLGDWMKLLPGLSSGDSLMISFYSRTDHLGAKYKPFFQKLLSLPDTSALLFHCTAGKDRTGIGAALFLYALNVPNETIMEDYLASNIYRRAENEKMISSMVSYLKVKEQVAKDMAAVKPQYLQATYMAIKDKYGSVENFMSAELGLDNKAIQKLRAMYLMPVSKQ